MSQLDSLAENLKAMDLAAGQIHVVGYSAVAANSIEPVRFSLERAIHVINELKNRGVPGNLFSEPKGLGEANLWGNNTSQATRSPNRRVRVLLDVIIPAAVTEATDVAEAVTFESQVPETPKEAGAAIQAATTVSDSVTPAQADSRKKFSWLCLLLLLLLILAIIFLIIFLLSKRRKKSAGVTASPSVLAVEEPAPPEPSVEAEAVIANDSAIDALNTKRSKYMELEKSIREIISAVPGGDYIDLHTIVSRLLQLHDEIYFTNIGNYTTAAQYHSKISSIVTDMTDIVELVGKSYSRNIHFNFSECNIFRKKTSK